MGKSGMLWRRQRANGILRNTSLTQCVSELPCTHQIFCAAVQVPLGVVLCIPPFNYPVSTKACPRSSCWLSTTLSCVWLLLVLSMLEEGVLTATAPRPLQVNLAVSKIAPALMGGNTVVLKPPSQGAASAVLMSQTFVKAGIPPGVFNCVTGEGSQQPMLHICKVKHAAFTKQCSPCGVAGGLHASLAAVPHTGCGQQASWMA